MAKKTIDEEAAMFVSSWASKDMIAFLYDIIPLFELFDVSDDSDWVVAEVGEDDAQNVRLLRSMYLVSKIAENHAAKLCSIKIKHPALWKRLEQASTQ